MAEHSNEWTDVPLKELRETLATLKARYNASYTAKVRQQIVDELTRRGEKEEETP